MRAMLMAAVGLALGFTLFGCDQNPQQAQTATPVAVAPPPAPCKCQQAPVATPVRAVRHRAYHRHFASYDRYEHTEHHGHTLSEFLAYSTGPSSYSESESSSVREYRPGDEEQYSRTSTAEMHDTASGSSREMASNEGVWVDGFGKPHYADYGPIEDEHPGLVSGKDEHERQKPWRGYNSKCDNRVD